MLLLVQFLEFNLWRMDFPLHYEVTLSSDLQTIENCLKSGEDPNRKDDNGNAPLHCISYYAEEAYKIVELLLNYGADMMCRDGLGRLPFELALELANTKACQTYKDRGFSLTKSDRMRNGTYELFSNIELFQPSDAVEVLQVLVDLGVDLTATLSSSGGENLLHKGIESGASVETAQFLIRSGISVNSRNSLGMTPLHMLWFLNCSPTDRYDEEKSRHSKLVKLLINEGYEINSQDVFGRTVLHYVVAELRMSSLMEFIISHGADVNIQDRNGIAPLHLACSWKNEAYLKKILESRNCVVSIQDNNRANVFHYTVFYNNPATLKHLLTKCDSGLASVPDSSGRTPLQWARYFGYAELIDLFENFFQSMNIEFRRASLPDVFPLKDEFDHFKMQEEVVEMQCKDFSLNDDPNRTLKKLLKSPVLGKQPEIAETSEVQIAVSKVIERVASKVSKACPLFSFKPEISGSVSEGTKCGFPNEFDFLCTMVKLSECFQEPLVASSPPMFCWLQVKPDLCVEEHEIMQYLDKDNSLRSAKLISDFSDQLNLAFLKKETWEDISGLAPVSVCIMAANATKIMLKWHGQVYKDLTINVDIVPAMHFPNFWPPNASETALQLHKQLKERGIHVVMALHAEKFFTTGEKHFRLSFSLAETDLFKVLPGHVRLGYILAKAVRSTYVCSQIASTTETQEQPSDSVKENQSRSENEELIAKETWLDDNVVTAEKVISSYFLKNALFGLASKAYLKEIELDIQNSCEDQVVIWARLVYDCIENCLEQDELPSFFLPGINLLEKNYDSEQHMKVFYGGLEFQPMDEELMQDLDDALQGTIRDVRNLRKPFVTMLKGILQSPW